jgi:endoplasmic reticulum junction formation protein lunapark
VNALLGEDETRPDRRLALICSKCRLVNGLAPPGARTPEEVGKWRCSSCGSWNGVELPSSKKTTPGHSQAPSIAVTNVDEVIQRARSESADSESTEGFESLG